MWGLMRHDEALAVNRAACDRLGGREGTTELTLNEAMLLTYSGRPLDALGFLEALPELTDSRARALRALAELQSLVAVGRCETAVVEAGRAFAEQSELPEQIAIPGPGVHILTQTYALAECGRLAESNALATAAYEATPATAPPDAFMWLSHQRGRSALLSGQTETATRWLEEALAGSERHNMTRARRLVLSSLATAHAYRGEAAAAAATVAELDRLPPFPFVRPEQEQGRAWALVVAGDLPGARRILLAAAETGAAAGYFTTEAMLLHDVARLGDPGAVVDRLAELAERGEGQLVVAYADHAAAAAGGRPDALAAAVDRFEGLGALLLAAEAATEAAQAYQRRGDRPVPAPWPTGCPGSGWTGRSR